MDNLRIERGERALVVVAHPDDETIWMGGVLLYNPDAAWTIFSLARGSDADRAPKFARVCGYYGARGIITDLDDEGRLGDREAVSEAQKYIKEKIGSQEYSYIFTHGKNGEYGHPVHIQTHSAVNNLLRTKVLKGKKIFYFDYVKKHDRIISGENPDFIVNLGQKEYLEKRRIVSEMYGYPPDGIDVGYCTNPEAFKSLK